MPQPKQFEDHRYKELAAFIELLYLRNGVVPTANDLRTQIPDYDISDATYRKFLDIKEVREYLVEDRAIPLDATARLTQDQLDWIRVVTDPTDMRPVAKKLQELGLKRAQVTSWQGNKFYQQVLYEQTNRTFGSSRYAVLRSLQAEAMAGSVSAIKIYLELTGDYTQKAEVNVTVETRSVLNGLVEILQKYLDPETLLKVVDEMEQLAVPDLPKNSALAVAPVIKALPKPRKPAYIDANSEEVFNPNEW